MGRTADDYAGALARLMPQGRAWRFNPGSRQAQLLLALARGFARIDSEVDTLLSAYLPGDNPSLLAEWEATLGLDPASLTVEQRQARIRARFVVGSGPSLPFITAVAQQLGFGISITRYAPARAGVLTAGAAVYGEAWCPVIGITVEADSGVNDPADLIATLQPYSAHILFILLS
ncbi:putative phage tail protein [Novosphingobium humi]|uniref:DUF2313 domain-containing protein n=1 Tax=Novosphingobium humi TaxID=2282397 RepID=A0ABY7TZG6_9SPHN|nr:putative phage tail protein [Novosphingobium humi]WCT78678.1 DUF2313 domain-containing protein [Novosphingobium humi]